MDQGHWHCLATNCTTSIKLVFCSVIIYFILAKCRNCSAPRQGYEVSLAPPTESLGDDYHKRSTSKSLTALCFGNIGSWSAESLDMSVVRYSAETFIRSSFFY